MRRISSPRKQLGTLLVGVLALGLSIPVHAEQTPGTTPARPSQSTRRAGFDVFGGAGITWAASPESFEAVGLEQTAAEFGGGARATNIWRNLFLQATVSRWSDSGERVFVDSSGERFPLGIALDLKATYVDVSTGWKTPVTSESGRTVAWTYVGAGAGVAMYSEQSPFAEPGDDLDTTAASYHVYAGIEVPVVSRLAAAIDARYRFVPNVFGEGGVTGERDEDVLGGFQISVGARLGFGGGSSRLRPPAPAATPPSPPRAPTLPPRRDLEAGVITEAAPVFLLPDATRTPLNTLAAGTAVRILEETPDWVRIEFRDHLGSRVGYVQRKFVRRP